MLWDLLYTTPPPTQSSDFFSSPIWQFLSGAGAIIAIPIAIIATITAILAYRHQQRRKEITYQIVSDAPIVNINKAVESRVEIRLDGNIVRDARLLVLKVWNTGNVAIISEDYFEAIRFEFPEGTVISTDLLETTPKSLIPSSLINSFFKLSSNFVEIPTFPLNPNDSISLTILITGKSKINQQGRIKEGKLNEFDPNKQLYNRKLYYTLSVSFTILVLLGVISISLIRNSILTNWIFVISQIIYISILYITMRKLIRRRNMRKSSKNLTVG